VKRFLPPIVVFLLHRGLLATIAWICGYAPFDPASYSRWDSSFYLDIAARGYVPIHPCPPESHYPATAWCGNAGWFPGFPLVLRLTGLAPDAAAFVLCAAAELGSLLLLSRYIDDDSQWSALGFAGFFPGNVYFAALFPISPFLFAVLTCLGATWSRRYSLAAAAGAFAAMCHPTGILTAGVLLSWAVVRRRWAAIFVAAAVAAGFGVVLLIMHHDAGGWDAYFKVQAKYGYHIGPVMDVLLAHLKPLVNQRYRDMRGVVTAFQTLACLVLVASAAYRARSYAASDRELLALIYVAIYWLAPLALGGNLALYRSEALLLPAVLLVPGLPRATRIALLIATTVLTIPMAILFFRGVLV